ncbi:unnamed protein product [Sphagnum jensenii]|uniref:Uncharacterized protein n=1 Tax=Sphagnum jensenii TaxID=128206 RepID=A0ABP1BAJ4_9BRYO
MWGPGGVDEVRMKKSWAHSRGTRGWVSGARVTHAGCGWVGATTGGDRRRPDGPVTAEKCFFAGRACVAAQQNLRSLAEKKKKKKKKKELLARVLSLFSWSVLLLFTSLLIPNRHSFRALSSGEIFIVCGGRVSVYLFCFVPSYGGEVWPEWKTLV